MTKIKQGYIAIRRRKKSSFFASFFSGAHSRCTRIIIQQTIKALASADRDRDGQKRALRRLWVIRLNAVIRENGVYSSYSVFINKLYRGQLLLNRKILAQLAILNRSCLYLISNEI